MTSEKSVKLHYETMGDSSHPAVLLIHGLFGDLDNLKSISRHLESDYFVINVDVRNHGSSPWTEHMSFPSMSHDMLAVLDELKVTQAFILGHSMGGKIAMEVALSSPDRVRGLVIADIAPVAYEARHNTILDALESLDLEHINSRSDADKQLSEQITERGVRQFLLKNLRKEEDSWQWRMNLNALRENYAELIGAPARETSYEGPTLFIRGGNSDYIQAKHREAILKKFPRAEAKTIEGAGHWLHAEKPTVFNKLVARFLDENK